MIQTLSIQTTQPPQLGHRPMGDKAPPGVCKRHPLQGNSGREQTGGEPLSHSAHLDALLRSQKPPCLFHRFGHNVQRNRCNGIQLHNLRLDAVCRQPVCAVQQLVDQRAIAHQSNVRTLPQTHRRYAGRASLAAPLPAAGVAEGHRPFYLTDGVLQHIPQLGEAAGAEDGHSGDGIQKGRVEQAVMGLPVLPHQAGPVHCQHHMEPLEGDIVEEHIVAAL